MEVVKNVQKLEKYFEKVFKHVQHLSEANRELVARSWPAMALVFGAIQLYWAWVLWGFTRYAVPNSDFYDRIYVSYPDALAGAEKLVFYLGIFVLVLEALILLMAYSKLKARIRSGWDLLFLAMVVNTASAVVSLFISERGTMSFFLGILSSAIGFYLLFEVRGKYGHVKAGKSK
jgi:hypothetical protein